VQQVVAEFNASHPARELTVNYVISPTFKGALASQIAAGNPPDIVGPVNFPLSANDGEQWLDLAPLIDVSDNDLSQIDPALLELYQTEEGAVTGLPFAVFPSVTYYNRTLFDEAGLNYPPQAYGDPYLLPDGSQTEWNFDTVAEIAQLLTLDANGNNATDPAFDPANIVQYGFAPWNQDPRVIGSAFGAAALIAPDGQTVVIPEPWRAAWHWYYDGVWSDRFVPDLAVLEGDRFDGANPMTSEEVAMLLADLGYVKHLNGADGTWDLAPVPAYNGQTTVVLEANTFHILESSPNPDAAFDVLTYLLDDAAPQLLPLSGGLPARTALQGNYLDGLDAQFPHGVNWQVAMDGLAFAGVPSDAGAMPNYDNALQRLDGFRIQLFGTEGLDLDAEIARLEAELQAVVDAD
jgi:multiple sugar transport system substrate-binding protein